MASFKPVQRKILPRLKGDSTPDDKHWSDFEAPVSVKEHGPVQSISFSLKKPHYFAVTSSAKVQLFNPSSGEVHKTFTRFKEAAYGAELRSDGNLLSVGGEEGIVRLFDVGTKSLLRDFRNHKAPVHSTRFTPDNTHILSFGDDRAARYFDVAAQVQVRSFKDHGDYVRAGDIGRFSQNIFVSGCYDHKARAYDLRSKDLLTEVDHGSPVESVLMFPNGNIFITAGGSTLKVWDLIGGGLCIATLQHHHKTITDLCFGSNYTRLLSASIDRHVKVYDLATYSLVHSMDLPSPVMSIGVSPDDNLLCIGMTDGVLSIRKRREPVDLEAIEKKRQLRQRFSRHLVNEQNYQPEQGAIVVSEEKRAALKKYDIYLKSFEFTKALDSVMRYHIWNLMPDVTISVLQEIDRRGGLRAALAGRSPQELIGIIGFLCRYITDPRFTTVVMGVADVIWELYPYMYGKSKELDLLVNRLQDILQAEVYNQKELRQIIGTMDVLLSMSELNTAESVAETVISPAVPVTAAVTESLRNGK